MKNIKNNLSISLVIPTYNDEKTVIQQIIKCENILKNFSDNYEIIIADDYSQDNTRKLLLENFEKRKEYKIILNNKNLGISGNVRQLYLLAKNNYIFFYSADGDWNPNDTKLMIQTLLRDNADIVIGKRNKKIGYTFYRNALSFFHKLLPLILFGVDTIDPGGIKIIKKQLAQIPLVSTSQFFEAEIIIKAKQNGYKISWCSVTYKKTFYGSGHGGAISSALRALIDVFKLRFTTFLS